MPYCPFLPNPTTTRGPRYLYLQKNFGFKCNFMHAYAADRLVENPCVKLAFCIMPLYNTKSASLKQLWSFLASFLYHVISVSIKPHATHLHYNDEFQPWNLIVHLLKNHNFRGWCVCITSYSLFSHNITQWNDLQWKVAFLWGPTYHLSLEVFEAFFSNLSSKDFNDWCVIKANRKQNKRCTFCLTTSPLLPSPINKV